MNRADAFGVRTSSVTGFLWSHRKSITAPGIAFAHLGSDAISTPFRLRVNLADRMEWVRSCWSDVRHARPWRALLACARRLRGTSARRAPLRLGSTLLLRSEHAPGRIELKRGSMLQVHLQAQARITCEVGQAWITRDNSSLGTVLPIGGSVEMRGGTRISILAMPIAAVRLQHV